MFRFRIRDMLWLTVVVGLGVGWWMQRRDALATAAANKEQALQIKDLSKRLENAEWWAKKYHDIYRAPPFVAPGQIDRPPLQKST